MMGRYDPEIAPSPEEWLELDEQERSVLIEMYHEEAGFEFPEDVAILHATVHEGVENQIALRVDGVCEAIDRLKSQGLSRHDAVHAVGAVLAAEMQQMWQRNEAFDAERYAAELNKLTAESWRAEWGA